MYYIPLPDNKEQFFLFVNMVINNRNNQSKLSTSKPNNIGPHSIVRYCTNEVGEDFIVVCELKAKKFCEMVLDQFCCLRTYIDDFTKLNTFQTADQYEKSL